MAWEIWSRGTQFHDVNLTNPALAARLRDRFFERALGDLRPGEAADFLASTPPKFEVSDEINGGRYARFTYNGVTAECSWTGAEDELVALVDEWVAVAVDAITTDYWEREAWRDKTSFTSYGQ